MSNKQSEIKQLQGKQVLFVNDNLEILRHVKFELEQYGLEVSTCESAFDIPERLNDPTKVFDMVITDLLGMTKGEKNFEPHRQLQPLIERFPAIPFLIYTVQSDGAFQYEDKGVKGYVVKEDGIGELINALIHILVLKKQSVHWSKSIRPNKVLSPQERKVLCYAGEGLDPPGIARALTLSVHTVNDYLQSARRKLGASDTKHAIAISYKEGHIG